MSHSWAKAHRTTWHPQWMAFLLAVLAAACAPAAIPEAPAAPSPTRPAVAPTQPVPSTIIPPSATPATISLALPSGSFVEERRAGIETCAREELSDVIVQVFTVDQDAATETPDLWLQVDGQDLPIAERPWALAVPWTSEWQDVSLSEAQDQMSDGSPFVAILPWEAMKPTLRALRVDGLHPSQPGYPLVEHWSLQARPGLESLTRELAPCLRSALGPAPVVHLAAVGDMMLDRSLGERLRAGDLAYPFAAVQPLLMVPDLAIGNLESGLGLGGRPENKGYVFRAPPEAATALAQAGFDLLTLANNHAMDYGAEGLLEAIQRLEAAGLAIVGAGENAQAAHRPAMIEVQGLRLAFLAYVDVPVEVRGFDARKWQATEEGPGVAWADPAQIRADVQAASRQADVVIVLLHSGYEYVPQPSPPQQAAARAALEAGAALVIGHHAHVLQPVEFHEAGVIAYGLGNLAFEDAGPPASAILNIWLDADGLREIAFSPIWIESDGRPRPATPEEARAILAEIHSLTLDGHP